MRRKIHCITKNGTNPAYEGARIGARRIAEREGYSLTSSFPQKPDDAEEQAQLLKAAIEQTPDAIMISVADPLRLDPLLKKAKERGIFVISFVSKSAALPPDCFVTSDNQLLAQKIAPVLFARMGGAGAVAIIEGNPASETSGPRTEGFLKAIEANPGIKLVAQETGYYQRDLAHHAMQKILQDGKRIDGVLVANDYMALGVIEALNQARLEVPVVSVNAMPQAIDALKSGELLATAAFDAMKIACVATMATIRLLEGKPIPRDIVLPVEVVDRDNCSPWEKGYEDRPLAEWPELMDA